MGRRAGPRDPEPRRIGRRGFDFHRHRRPVTDTPRSFAEPRIKNRGRGVFRSRYAREAAETHMKPQITAAGRTDRTGPRARERRRYALMVRSFTTRGTLFNIAAELNAKGIATARGGKWAAEQVSAILKRAA